MTPFFHKMGQSGQSGAALVYALVLSGMVGMMGMAAMSVAQRKSLAIKSLERRGEVDELRAIVAQNLLCPETMRAVCELGLKTLVSRGRQLDTSRFKLVDRETARYGKVAATDKRGAPWQWVVSVECSPEGVQLYYAAVRGQAFALDPASRRPFAWRPLSKQPMCRR